MIKNLSPSRASQFKTCPRQFKYANIDKIKEPTNEVQAKGTTVHEALEKLFDLPQDERSLDNLHNLFRRCGQMFEIMMNMFTYLIIKIKREIGVLMD